MANEPVKSIQAAGVMTTLGITSNGKPVTSDKNKTADETINFFSLPADKLVLAQKTQSVGLPFAKNLYQTQSKEQEIVKEKQLESQAEKFTETPTIKRILSGFGKDLLRSINKYDRTFNGGKLANQVLPSESDIYWAAASNSRFPAILLEMQQQMV